MLSGGNSLALKSKLTVPAYRFHVPSCDGCDRDAPFDAPARRLDTGTLCRSSANALDFIAAVLREAGQDVELVLKVEKQVEHFALQ